MSLIHLDNRGVVKVSGPDAAALLNGLLTNDVTKASDTQAVFAAMLTPQGKYLFDIFVLRPEATVFVLDVSRPLDFAASLGRYRLRSQVVIEAMSDVLQVYAEHEAPDAVDGALKFSDPRLASLGYRFLAPTQTAEPASTYHAHRIALGVPEPSVDLLPEKDFVMEGLFDELNGIDFHKGCYVGQEMTSRMKRRTSVKSKLCRVRYEGAAPEFETPILADNWEVGRMRSCLEGIGLEGIGLEGIGMAMIRFDRADKALFEGHDLKAGETIIRLDPPDWLVRPLAAQDGAAPVPFHG